MENPKKTKSRKSIRLPPDKLLEFKFPFSTGGKVEHYEHKLKLIDKQRLTTGKERKRFGSLRMPLTF